MQYSCGYWKRAETLEQAQEAKLELICAKLQLKQGMTLLDIGCGWEAWLNTLPVIMALAWWGSRFLPSSKNWPGSAAKE